MSLFNSVSKDNATLSALNGVISPASSQSNGDLSTRRPALLPAFEPVSSSPIAPSRKRRFEDDLAPQGRAYPTPVPTSSTGILTSSSPQRRPGLVRTMSTLSERAPLQDVPTVSVPENGDQIILGRSGNSCYHKLPYNSLISRQHVSINFNSQTGHIIIRCIGWNGCIVRCGARIEELKKDEIFATSNTGVDIIVDIIDTRVILAWPEIEQPRLAALRSESPWELTPSRRQTSLAQAFASSPPAVQTRSPQVSPSPVRRVTRPQVHDPVPVTIYEDPTSDANNIEVYDVKQEDKETGPPPVDFTLSSSSLSSLDYSDNENEENEEIIHSFGPFGADLLQKLDSFSANSPEQKRKFKANAILPSSISQPIITPTKQIKTRILCRPSPLKNHVLDQLAFSRVHAVPISSIFKTLPIEMKQLVSSPSASDNTIQELTKDELCDLLHNIPCVGEISRSGKDAAGKHLENEYYYVPEMDDNAIRREAHLGSMGSTSLRSVRRTHKQYFWKRPRH